MENTQRKRWSNIEADDLVNVYQLSGNMFAAKVLYVPVASGDCWRLRRLSDGALIYLQSFELMVLAAKAERE